MQFVIWFTIIILVIFSAFFSGSEAVIISSDKHLLREKARKGDNKAKKVIDLASKPDVFLSAILVGNNICIVSVSILFQNELEAMTGLSGLRLSTFTTLIVSFFMLIFAEITPKSVGFALANKLAYISTALLKIFYYGFYPVIKLVSFVTKTIEKLIRLKLSGEKKSIFYHKSELKSFFINTSLIEDIESNYISKIMNYSKTTAREIMTPLIDVVSIEKNASVDDLISIISKYEYSRIPVYEERVDNFVYYINSKDLIDDPESVRLDYFFREPYFVPETKKVGEILMDMQRRKVPIVFVIDEYGGSSGVITDEDIAEEIVGDILLENEEENIVVLREGSKIMVNSQVDVDYLNEEFDLDIEKEGFETIAGFVMYILGHIPKEGEHFEYKDYHYIVSEADEKSISKVLIEKSSKKDNTTTFNNK